MNKAVVALGSNMEPEMHIEAALQAIKESFCVLKVSSFIYTKAVVYEDQPDFLNGSVLIKTTNEESETTAILKHIEKKLGRQKSRNPNGPRKIDLDLIIFNERVMDDDVFERDFLQKSIHEVLPNFELPK